jgi:hypothetical protein
VASAYQTLKKELGSDLLTIDKSMPALGRSEDISKRVKLTSDLLIDEAGGWSAKCRTLVRPGEPLLEWNIGNNILTVLSGK